MKSRTYTRPDGGTVVYKRSPQGFYYVTTTTAGGIQNSSAYDKGGQADAWARVKAFMDA